MGLFDFIFGRKSAEQTEAAARVAEARARVEAIETAGAAHYEQAWAQQRERARLERYFFWSSAEQVAWCRAVLERSRSTLGGDITHFPADHVIELRFTKGGAPMRVVIATGSPSARIEAKIRTRVGELALRHDPDALIGDSGVADQWAEDRSIRRAVAPGVFVEGEPAEVDESARRLAALSGSFAADVTAFMTHSVRVIRGQTIELGDGATMEFTGHGHKSVMAGGPPSPLLVRVTYRDAVGHSEDDQASLHPPEEATWHWRDHELVLGEYAYDDYMVLELARLALTPAALEQADEE